jgi:hypothetical protein
VKTCLLKREHLGTVPQGLLGNGVPGIPFSMSRDTQLGDALSLRADLETELLKSVRMIITMKTL